MSIDGGDSPKTSMLSEFKQSEFNRSAKLTRDSFNQWAAVRIYFSAKAECERYGHQFTQQLYPLKHYRAYYENSRSPEALEELMQRSDPSAVAAFDTLVDELYAQPIISSKTIMEWTKFSRIGSQKFIDRFIKLGILDAKDKKETYNRTYIYQKYIDIFTK